jgi:hypothetical protein
VTSKIVIALTLSSWFVFPTTAAPSHGPIARENKLISTSDNTGFPIVDLQTGSQQWPQVTLFLIFLGSARASPFPASDLSVGTERQGLILLGCALLLFGSFWLKRTRRAPRSVGNQKPAILPPAPMYKPEPDPVWIEVALSNESNPETCDEAQITA